MFAYRSYQAHFKFQNTPPKMYPRVKVRKYEEEEEDDDFSSPSKENGSDLLVQEKENQNDPQDLIARIANPFVPDSTPQSVSTPKVKNKLHASPYSISRPRAVLSSPANDGMIGNRMKAKNESCLGLRKCNSEPCKKQTQIKANGGQAKAESSALRKFQIKTAAVNMSSVKREQISKPRIAASKLQLQKHSLNSK